MKNELENVNSFMRSEKERKKYIELFVEKLYTRFNYLFSESLDEIKEKALDKYLYTEPYYNMSYDEIALQMTEEIERRKKQQERSTKEIKETYINNNEIIEPIKPVVEENNEFISNNNEIIHNTNESLNEMLNETPKEETIDKSPETNISKQYVKTDNSSSNKQGGFISIFNIVLALLGLTAFGLIAMILNLLLK